MFLLRVPPPRRRLAIIIAMRILETAARNSKVNTKTFLQVFKPGTSKTSFDFALDDELKEVIFLVFNNGQNIKSFRLLMAQSPSTSLSICSKTTPFHTRSLYVCWQPKLTNQNFVPIYPTVFIYSIFRDTTHYLIFTIQYIINITINRWLSSRCGSVGQSH